MGVKNYIFWSEIGSAFGEPGGTPPPRIPRSTPPPSQVWTTGLTLKPQNCQCPGPPTFYSIGVIYHFIKEINIVISNNAVNTPLTCVKPPPPLSWLNQEKAPFLIFFPERRGGCTQATLQHSNLELVPGILQLLSLTETPFTLDSLCWSKWCPS